jgi:hypothetical protein
MIGLRPHISERDPAIGNATAISAVVNESERLDIKVKGVKYRPLQEKESRSSMWPALRGDRSSPQEEMFAILARSLGARFTR